jgi:hypothetical protein
MKKLLFSVTLAALTLISCKKDKDECATNSDTLAGNYRITSAQYKQTPTSTSIDYLAFLDACERDDIYALVAGGVFNYQDAGTVCVPPGGYSGTWSYTGTTLTIDGEATTIQSFDCTTLVTVFSDVNTAGDKLTITFVKQ